jgi:hypothetical protein
LDTHALKQALFNKVIEQGLFSCGREAVDIEFKESGGIGESCDLCYTDFSTERHIRLGVEFLLLGFKPFLCNLLICYTQDECETNQLVKKFQESVET